MRLISFLSFFLAIVASTVAAISNEQLLAEFQRNLPGLADLGQRQAAGPARMSVGSPTATTPSYHADIINDLGRRATGWQCTCKGYQYHSTSLYNFVWIDILHYKTGTTGAYGDTTNPLGWCFQNGVMNSQWLAYISNAYETSKNDIYANGSFIHDWCGDSVYCANGACKTEATCVAHVASTFYDLLVAANAFTTCTWPTTNYVPVDCLCNFKCTNGYVACGRQCINPATQTCTSGVATTKTAKRYLLEDDGMPIRDNGDAANWLPCDNGLQRCGASSACIDTQNHLESCGGCAYNADGSTGNGTDCSVLPGVNVVSCKLGQCKISSCDNHHTLLNGECVPRGRSRRHY